MGLQLHNYGIIIMILILVFALIHLGVSISIIINSRRYGDIFEPEIGLSCFNIVVSFLGIQVGAFGLLCLLTNQQLFGKIIAIVAGVLGIFALASLITVVVINSKSANYVTTHFSAYMHGYRIKGDAKNVVDRVQKKYQCCGRSTWFDWAYDNTSPVKVTLTEKPMRSVRTAITSLKEDITTLRDDYSSKLSSRTHYIDRRETNHLGRLLTPLTLMSRQKRQAALTNSITYDVTINDQFLIPRSCCSILIHNLDGTVQTNCVSYDQFYSQGCLKYLMRRSNQQDMGIGIINCFMIVLAFVSIPFLIYDYPTSNVDENNIPKMPIPDIQEPNLNYQMPIDAANTYL